MKKFSLIIRACAASATLLLGFRAQSQEFSTYDSTAEGSNTALVPVLDNGDATDVGILLKENREVGQTMAVRVREVLTESELTVLQALPLSGVFCDYTGTDKVALTAATGRQVLRTTSRNAFVGNFNIYPNATLDSTRPATTPASIPRFANRPTATDWPQSHGRIGDRLSKRMAMPALLPGSPDYRSPAAGNSGAPNIRTALFALPIQRLTFAALGIRGLTTPNIDKPQLHNLPGQLRPIRLVPVVARFNNYGNSSLEGAPSGNGLVQNAGNPSNGQLPSRGDFQAQMLHYRMRGATSAVLFNSTSVVGYSATQHASDMVTGWNASVAANGIFNRNRYGFANMTNLVQDSPDALPRSTELSGAVWSGVFDRVGPDRRLAILVSNMGNVQRTIHLPKIGGKEINIDPPEIAADPNAVVINPGVHRVLHFHFEANEWHFDGDAFIGLDNNRNGVGVGGADPPANP